MRKAAIVLGCLMACGCNESAGIDKDYCQVAPPCPQGPPGKQGPQGLPGEPGPGWQIYDATQTKTVTAEFEDGWIDVPGAKVQFELQTNSTIDMTMQGVLTTYQVPVTTAWAECVFRFVVDGVPEGNEDTGNALATVRVQQDKFDSLPYHIVSTKAVAEGSHLVQVQIKNYMHTDAECILMDQVPMRVRVLAR